ncbi:MAG TPA: tetratricopeptide repeat protein [Methanocella sp.]|nr:tetratricopeptide repeat protein [Methanocella sp.]
MMDDIERQRRRGNFKGAENLAKLEMKEYELQEDMSYFNFYRGLLWYLHDYPHEALMCFNNALLTDDKDMFYTYKFKGVVYLENGRLEQAQDSFETAIGLAEEKSDIISILNCLGNTYLRTGNTQRALELYSEALEMSYNEGLDDWAQTSLTNVGVAHVNMGDYKGSMKFFEGALELAKAIGDPRGERICLNNIAGTFNNMGQHQEAMALFQDALKIAEQANDVYGIRVLYANIGYTHRLIGNMDLSLEYYNRALETAQQIGDHTGEAIARYWINSLQEGKKRFVAP